MFSYFGLWFVVTSLFFMNVAISKCKVARLLEIQIHNIIENITIPALLTLLLFVPPGCVGGEARERYSSPPSSLAWPVLRLGQRLVDWRLEAPHMFHRHVLRLAEGSLQIFVESGEYLTVQNLESSDSVNHSLQLNSFDIFVLAVHSLNPEDVIAEVQTLEPSLLGEKDDHDTARPVESLAKQLLHSELIFSNWDTVDKLQGRPQPVELCALVNIQDSVSWRFPVPHSVL